MSAELSSQDHALIEAQLALAARATAPYAGHMRLEIGGRSKDVLLGSESRLVGELPIIDWRRSPLGAFFFAGREGEAQSLRVHGRTLQGVVHSRALLGFEDGALVEIRRGRRRLRRGLDGVWRASALRLPRLAPRPDGQVRRAGALVEVQLDPAQRRVVALPPGQSVLVLGEAGFGKTTVALHRLAALLTGAPQRRAAVIVPVPGLARLVEEALVHLGLTRVRVHTYDRFAAAQARAVFPKLPARESEGSRAGASAVKRHPALRAVLPELVRERRRTSRRDLLHLFGDGSRMDRVRALAGGALSGPMIAELLEHTHVQFSRTTERAHAHVDRDRLLTLDHRRIDAGTPMADAASLDVEDYAVLLELDRLRSRAQRRPELVPPAYDVLLVDEAQELAPLELALIGRSLAPGGTLIVAGDALQATDDGACFAGWAKSMAELGAGAYQTAVLEQSYRNPPEITALAQAVRFGRRGSIPGAVARCRFDDPLQRLSYLAEALPRLGAADPWSRILVLAHSGPAAEELARVLAPAVPLRLAAGDLDLRPGVVVGTVRDVKGLEFDHVLLADAEAYPDTAAGRRALYVGLTRASHQLALLAVGPGEAILDWDPAD